LVGRDVELAHLTSDLEGAAEGRGSAIVAIGEPGIGKTALGHCSAR
jgi:predicted ATPase